MKAAKADMSIGRNRMEFKVCSWYSSMTCCNGIGRNRMEFKVR